MRFFGPPTDKTCHKVPLQVNFFRWRHFALPYLSTSRMFSRTTNVVWPRTYAVGLQDGLFYRRYNSYKTIQKYLRLEILWKNCPIFYSIILLLFTWEVKPMGGVFTRSLQAEDKAVNRGRFYLSFSLAEAKVCLLWPPAEFQVPCWINHLQSLESPVHLTYC